MFVFFKQREGFFAGINQRRVFAIEVLLKILLTLFLGKIWNDFGLFVFARFFCCLCFE
jgi:hypothetical protein